MEALEKNRASFRDFLNIIFKRRLLFLLFFILTFATVTLATLMVKPVYEASARLLVETGNERVYVPATASGDLVVNINREAEINSEVEILKSKSLVKEVVTVLGATSIYPELGKQARGILATILPEIKDDKSLLEKAQLALQKKLRIRGIKKSNVIKVSFKHIDPQMATDVVNTLTNLYLVRRQDVHSLSQSRKFFLQQTEFLKQRLTKAQVKLEQLKRAHNVANFEEQQKILLQRMHDLRISLHELNKIKESRIPQGMDSQNLTSVNLIEPAQVPLKPVSPKGFLNLVLGMFLGLLIGLGVAFFLHYLDDSLESVEDVEAALDVPVLISIPYDKKEGA